MWLVIKTGWDLQDVMDMDVLSFNAVCGTLTTIIYREKAEQAWVDMIASQGEKSSMERLTSGWLNAIGEKPTAPKGNFGGGMQGFMKQLGMGKKGGSF